MHPLNDEKLSKLLAKLERKDFDHAVKTRVRVETSQGIIELDMIEASTVGASFDTTQFRDPFSLIFRGPLSPRLASGTYLVELEKLGRIPLFLNPVVPSGREHMYYQSAWT